MPAYTDTEIVSALSTDADVVRTFPINAVGADYMRQLRGPLPILRSRSRGGLQPDSAGECVTAGAAVVGIGSHLLGAAADGQFDPQSSTAVAEYLTATRPN